MEGLQSEFYPCSIFSSSFSVPLCSPLSRAMRCRSTGCEPAMLLISFGVAVALAVYLLVTLLRPERF